MQKIVFYSWQSDLPNATNRGFIQQALEKAAAKIVSDNSVEVEPVVDRDTKGVAGSPDIATTIFGKITAADIFVADVSIINAESKSRHTPNPNVLIELGYALRSLGFERVILTFNLAYGKIERLPFDLRMRRVMTYNMPLEADGRSEERRKLEGQLEDALRSALENTSIADDIQPILPSIHAIELGMPNRILLLRKDLKVLLSKIEALAPARFSAGGTVEELLISIDQTQETVAEFSKITENAVVMKDGTCLLEIYRWLGKILEKYRTPADYSGRVDDGDYDYYRFLGHELIVTIYAFLLKEHDWDLINLLIKEPIPINYLREEAGPADVGYVFACEYLRGLEVEEKRQRKLCLQGFILNQRHKEGGLSGIMPINEFAAADLLLYLHNEFTCKTDAHRFTYWIPWSIIYLKEYPLFLKRTERKRYAKILADMFILGTTDALKEQLADKILSIRNLFSGGMWDLPIRNVDFEKIATID